MSAFGVSVDGITIVTISVIEAAEEVLRAGADESFEDLAIDYLRTQAKELLSQVRHEYDELEVYEI